MHVFCSASDVEIKTDRELADPSLSGEQPLKWRRRIYPQISLDCKC